MIERRCVFHNAAAATATGEVLNCTGLTSLLVQITGTFTASVAWKGSVDESNYVAVKAINLTTGAAAATATAAGLYLLNVSGLRRFIADLTWTSGTSITVIGVGVDSTAPVVLSAAYA